MPQGARLTNTQRLADRYMTDANWKIVEGLQELCAKRGWSMLDLAFSWLAVKPEVASVIAGATKTRADRAERQGRRSEAPRPRIWPRSTAVTTSAKAK